MHTATLSSKYQIVIPKTLRESIDIKAGQKFIMVPMGNTIQLVPLYSLEEMRGIMAGADTSSVRDRNDRL